MTQQELQKIFESEFSWDNWKKVMNFVFPEFKFNLVQTDLTRDTKAHKKDAGFIKEHGSSKLSSLETLTLCEILVSDRVRLDRNIKSVRSLVADLSVPHFQTIIAVFHNADNTKWRFTLVVKEFLGDGKIIDKKPDSYTYVFGLGERGRTASERFLKLANNSSKTLKDLEEAFSVEALSKKFFKEYHDSYDHFVKDISSNPSRMALFKETTKEKQEKSIRNFVKKMMGRLVFLYFLQKKGWLGCKTKWKDGDEQFMKAFVEKAQQNDSFYHNYLEPLFFDTLNDRRAKQDEDCIIQKTNFGKVPYLNGGLFEKDENHPETLTISWKIFRSFFETLNNYNFTIIEDDPEFKEVAVDPEMLGHIFENQLEDNKDKGAFYTPKEIVHYMCQESLCEYLKNYLIQHKHWPQDEDEARLLETSLHRFVKQKLAAGVIDYDKPLAKAFKQVKICDPAIGSGAFPMGLLNEIYQCVHKLHHENPDAVGDVWGIGKEWQGNKVKLNIIQNSIYGVDIEKGAVDIARLRFWLSLIVDEPEPTPLPNLDYKIMQGNSLLESFEGINLKFDRSKYVKPIEKAKDLFGNISDKDKQISIAEAMATSNFDLVKMERDYFGAQNADQKELIRKQITDFEKKFINERIAEQERIVTETINTLARKLNSNRYETARQKKSDEKLMEVSEKELPRVAKAKEEARKIKEGNKPYFLWSLYFLNIVEEGGFDIVIGNPPYIQLQKMGKDADTLEKENYTTFTRTGDIYSLFYELGFNILKTDGVLTYITSNKWMRAAYGESLRKYFIEKTNPIQLIDFGGFQVFETATVDTNILVSKNSHFKNKVNTCVLGKGFSLSKMSDYFRQNKTSSTFDSAAWVVLDEKEQGIKTKIEKRGVPLREWNIKINYGIKTGLNDAFIIDEAKRNEIIKKSPKSEDIIRPILRGRDIDKYKANWDGLYLIYIPWHFPLHNDNSIIGVSREAEDEFKKAYPEIYDHLHSFKAELSARNKAETGIRYEWYALQRWGSNYMEDFSKHKVVWKRIGSVLRFSYDESGLICLDSTCFATGADIKFLVGYLNSTIGKRELLNTAPKTGTGDVITSVQALEPLLIPKAGDNEKKLISDLVDKCIQIISKDPNSSTSELDDKIDQIVFRLFDFTENEIQYIKAN